jgi:hypothetical protein
MSDKHREIVIEVFADADEAIRAIQGLKVAGFDTDAIRVSARGEGIAEHVIDITDVSQDDDWPRNPTDAPDAGQVRVVVLAGKHAALARRVMVDGIVDATGLDPASEEAIYLDSSTGSGAGVAASTGTATGITPGAGYEGNTGSTAATTPGALGQYAPRADTPDEDDDFPG